MNEFNKIIKYDRLRINIMSFMQKNYDYLDKIIVMYAEKIQDSIHSKELSLFHTNELLKYLKSDKCPVTDSIKKELILLCDRFKYGNENLSSDIENKKRAVNSIITDKGYDFYESPNIFLKFREE